MICPNQLRENGIAVSNLPGSLLGGYTQNPRSIYIPEADVTIPLKFKGVMLGFDTRITTQHELITCAHLVLTKDSRWYPSGLYLEQ